MSRRLHRRELRRSSAGSVRRLPGRALDRGHGLSSLTAAACVAGLCCAGGLALRDAAARRTAPWLAGAGRLLIVIPDPNAASAAAPGSRFAAVLAAAGTGARPVDQAALDALLGGASADGPGLIDAGAGDPGLAARVTALAPGSIVQPDGGAPALRLAAFASTLAPALDTTLAAIGLASLAAIAAAARAAVRRASTAARLLSRLGATRGFLLRHLGWPIAAAGLAGAAAGAGAVELALALAALPPDPRAAVIPPLAAAAAGLAASLSIRRLDRW